MASQSVTIIVSHYNSARTIGKCLSCLLAQDYPKNLLKIVVVDGGSTDGSQEIVQRYESGILRQYVRPGMSEVDGQIFGVANSTSEVIMLTNSDIYVPKDWIRLHLRWHERGYALVGGAVFWGGDKFALTWNMPKQSRPRFVQEQGLGLGFSNCSTTRQWFTRVGGLRRLKSQQDTEFALRMMRRGGKMVLDPEIEVYHDHPFLTYRGSFWRALGYAMNHVLVVRAAYGRIVAGPGYPVMISVGSFVKEGFGINGIRVYNERRAKAFAEAIRVNLVEFMCIRLFSTKLGQVIGVLIGAAKNNATFSSIANLHRPLETARRDPRG